MGVVSDRCGWRWDNVRFRLCRSEMEPTWWRHQVETFSALLALCEGNPPATGGFARLIENGGLLNSYYYWPLNLHEDKATSQRVMHVPWWRHQMETFSALLALVRGIHRSPVNSPHKGQWRGALMFLWSAPGQTVEKTIETPLIWDVMALIMASL